MNEDEFYDISDNKLFPKFILKASGTVKGVAWPRNSTSSLESSSDIKTWGIVYAYHNNKPSYYKCKFGQIQECYS